MPYRRLAELPSRVRDSLPRRAQEIYLEAYDSAWERYADPRKRRGRASREETAHRVAWAAVKRAYAKDAGGVWRRKRG